MYILLLILLDLTLIAAPCIAVYLSFFCFVWLNLQASSKKLLTLTNGRENWAWITLGIIFIIQSFFWLKSNLFCDVCSIYFAYTLIWICEITENHIFLKLIILLSFQQYLNHITQFSWLPKWWQSFSPSFGWKLKFGS